MANKKRSSVDYYIDKLAEILEDELGTESWLKIASRAPELAELYKQTKEMHKEEIEKSWWHGHDIGNSENKIYPSEDCNNYYNETFGGDNE